jgi:predicted Rossmann fold flavoprotein
MKKIIVVGAGASGLLAAGRAAFFGAEVLLLEKMKYPGRKLRITGKGHCNLTNVADLDTFMGQFGKNGKFLRSAFSVFFVPELMDFFTGLGINLETQRGGRVFPSSGSAPEVVDTLVKWTRGQGVTLKKSSPVDSLLLENGRVAGVRTRGGAKIAADAVVLAMGGASYPATGSDGDGFRLAKSVGHSIVSIRPALIPLETSSFASTRAAGLQLQNSKVCMLVNNKKKREEFGELLFTRFGVSGPTVLRLSGDAVDEMNSGNKVELSIDLKPGLDMVKLEARILRDLESRGTEAVSSILRGLLPKELVPVCLELTGINRSITGNQLRADSRKKLREWLKDFRLEVTGSRPLEEAIVTAGGISLKEVNPATMESRIVKNLFITGEMLDLQADTGGYNLQAAFSTGWLAGEAVIDR